MGATFNFNDDTRACYRCGRAWDVSHEVCSCGAALVCAICDEPLNDGRILTEMELPKSGRHTVHVDCKTAIEDTPGSYAAEIGRLSDDVSDALRSLTETFRSGFKRGFSRKMEEARQAQRDALRKAIEDARKRQLDSIMEAMQGYGSGSWSSFSVNAVFRVKADGTLGEELCPDCLVALVDKTCPACKRTSKPKVNEIPNLMDIDPASIQYTNMSREDLLRLMEDAGRKFGSMSFTGEAPKASETPSEARNEPEPEVELAPSVKDFLRSLDLGGI